MGASLTGGWFKGATVRLATDFVGTYDVALGLGAVGIFPAKTVLVGFTASGQFPLGAVNRLPFMGRAIQGGALVGGFRRGPITFTLQDTVLTVDQALVPRQDTVATDQVLTVNTVSYIPPGEGADQALTIDQALVTSQDSSAFDVSLTTDIVSSASGKAVDFFFVSDFATAAFSPAPGPGFALVTLEPQSPTAGTDLETGVSFLVPQRFVPSSLWNPIDPAAVSLTVLGGNGSTPETLVYGTDPRIIRLSTGVYYAVLSTTGTSGAWRFKWTGTTPCAAVATVGTLVLPVPVSV